MDNYQIGNELSIIKDKNEFPIDILNQNILPKENDFFKNGNKIEQATTKFTDKFVGNKRNRSKEKNIGKKERKMKEVCIEINNGNKKNMGRKRKNDINKGAHSKYSEDNIMRKIKSNFFFYILNLLNKSLINKDMQFLKLNSNLNENLKRDFNIDLLYRTIRDIYENSKISYKIKKTESSINKNIEIISKIYAENIEEQTIKILNLKYIELFKIFRSKIANLEEELEIKKSEIPLLNSDEFDDIHKFFTKIINEEMKKNESQENIDYYLNQMEKLCIGYEDWFINKKGRERKKKEKNNNN